LQGITKFDMVYEVTHTYQQLASLLDLHLAGRESKSAVRAKVCSLANLPHNHRVTIMTAIHDSLI
jgi:hypothetical protein